MAATCSHLDTVQHLEPPGQIAGCEDWGWCCVDELMFALQP